MSSLAELQQEFARALRDPGHPVPDVVRRTADAVSRRFDVYRNNVVVGLVDALKDAFPAVLRLVGDEYFSAVARVYVNEHPPTSPVLMLYGEEFAGFLERFPSAAGVPYLGDVARLEWAWNRAHHAPDAEPADITGLSGVSESLAESATLTLHPSLSLIESRWPVVSLWSASTASGDARQVDMEKAERAVVLRPQLKVDIHELSAGGGAFLDALSRGSSLTAAAGIALSTDGEFDLALQLQLIFQIGAVTAVTLPEQKKKS